ncbi:MAG: TIGR02266 family protein [Pseudomonadota bacterium]
MSEDKRTTPRIETNIDILFRESGAFIKSYMLNVSNGGLFLKTENPLPIDSVVTLRIRLPAETEPMEIQGCVVWSNPKGKNNAFPSGMGIQFIKINPENRIKIDAFVDQYRKEIKESSII